MVYDKTRSGDPDYDDKQPPEFHAGGLVVSAGDGVILSPTNGPVNAEGAHVNLAVDTDDLDHRPSPGNVASQSSEVQDYSAEDTPAYMPEARADSKDVDAIVASQSGVRASQEGQQDASVPGGNTKDADKPEAIPTPTPARDASGVKAASSSKSNASK
jgi:hypothetical protein